MPKPYSVPASSSSPSCPVSLPLAGDVLARAGAAEAAARRCCQPRRRGTLGDRRPGARCRWLQPLALLVFLSLPLPLAVFLSLQVSITHKQKQKWSRPCCPGTQALPPFQPQLALPLLLPLLLLSLLLLNFIIACLISLLCAAACRAPGPAAARAAAAAPAAAWCQRGLGRQQGAGSGPVGITQQGRQGTWAVEI